VRRSFDGVDGVWKRRESNVDRIADDQPDLIVAAWKRVVGKGKLTLKLMKIVKSNETNKLFKESKETTKLNKNVFKKKTNKVSEGFF
jgi:hypothetical protein